ncbi:hypothetical protein [Moritella sp. 28]|uniref:hypothetical protein n=1 Tax=Moritella sp. 28 TaxID=2746232 RepID=UPI001BA56326|nr:hypothetical protein [Moritella sp. 28]QUM84622.1 hypothetical protein HWV02_08955 [Moritella sp. 28]
MFKKVFFLLVSSIFVLCSHGASASTEYDVENGREIIKLLQNEIYVKVKLSKEELSNTKVDFQEYYQQEVLPRLDNISKNINESAIHWIDLDFDGKPELVFWTEGLSPTSWGANEYLFIVSINEKSNPVILKSMDLGEVSRNVKQYRYVKFWPEPNKNRGYNDFLRAVLSYGNFGVSGSGIINLQIEWNRYGNSIEISRFHTAFPFNIELKHKSENES